jgi:hypothetical protein
MPEGGNLVSPDASVVPVPDASIPDVTTETDTSTDSPAVADSGPLPIDPGLPSPPAKCAPNTDTAAFLVSPVGNFYSFDPQAAKARRLGVLSCPSAPSASPFTMTVASDAAYVVYSDATLFRVELSTLKCTSTGFAEEQLAAIGTARGNPESLLMYSCTPRPQEACAPTLSRIDLSSFMLTELGPIQPVPVIGYPVDAKGDAYGRFFALDASGSLIEVDTSTLALLGEDQTGLVAGPANALLTWNDELFIFTGAEGSVHRYDLATRQAIPLGAIGDTITGAGSAPCVP